MKKLILLLSVLFLLSADFTFAIDKQIIAPTGAIVLKGNTTAKVQTYNTGAWQDRLTILNNGNVGIGTTTPYYGLSVNSSTGINSYSGGGELGRFVLGQPFDPAGYVGMYRSATGPANVGTGGNSLGLGSYVDMTFSTGAASFVGQTERMRIQQDGKVGIGITAPTQALDVVGTMKTSVGLLLPSTAGSPTTLNHYQEGTWTPVVTAISGTITSYTATGTFVRIGRQVTLNFRIQITNNGTGAGSSSVSGLPFSCNAQGASGSGRDNGVTGEAMTFTMIASTGNFVMYKYNNTYGLATGADINGTLVYQV